MMVISIPGCPLHPHGGHGGGGGGAGGFLTGAGFSLDAGVFTMTVGAGGAAQTGDTDSNGNPGGITKITNSGGTVVAAVQGGGSGGNENTTSTYEDGKPGGSGGGGWDRYSSTGKKLGKCGDGKEGGAYAACLSKSKARKLGKKGIASFVKRKRAAQKKGGDPKKGGERKKGQKSVNVKNFFFGNFI